MSKDTKLFIVCGRPFSGKTELSKKIAQRYDAKIVGRDRIYFALSEMLALEEGPEDDDDKLWSNDLWPVMVQGVKNHLYLNTSVVVDDVCPRVQQRDELRALADEFGAKSVLVYLDVSDETLRERKDKNKITKERHDIPSAWLLDDAKTFERPIDAENPIIYTPETTFETLVETIG